MHLDKSFHLHLPVAEACARLLKLIEDNNVSPALDIERGESGVFRLVFEELGKTVSADIVGVDTAQPNEFKFHSRSGDVTIEGRISFFEIRENLTEVALRFDCQHASALTNALDAITGATDSLVNGVLARVEALLDGRGDSPGEQPPRPEFV